MSIAIPSKMVAKGIAEAIVSGDDWTPINLASRFVECFHRDQREGYASRFYEFLQVTRTGEEFIANIRPHSSDAPIEKVDKSFSAVMNLII